MSIIRQKKRELEITYKKSGFSDVESLASAAQNIDDPPTRYLPYPRTAKSYPWLSYMDVDHTEVEKVLGGVW